MSQSREVRVREVQAGPVTGVVALLALLVVLSATVGLGAAGWVAGLASGVVVTFALASGLARSGAEALGPANRVTLTRAVLACAVAGLVADSFGRPLPLPTLLTLTAVALVLDAVDGRVARRTQTSSSLGARFDMEVDAFLILVLSVYVSRWAGGWVLAIGLARYALYAAGWLFPWTIGPVPARYWRKVVAAIQGIVLAVAASRLLPDFWTDVALVVSLGLLTESFGRDVWGLWRRRLVRPIRIPVAAE